MISMSRSRVVAAFALLRPVSVGLLFWSVVAASAAADDRADCLDKSDASAKLEACTRLIEDSTKIAERADAYLSRGGIYETQGKYEPALNDFERAAGLQPASKAFIEEVFVAPLYADRGY